MQCRTVVVSQLSWTLLVGGVAYLLCQCRVHTKYGRYVSPHAYCIPARLAWFLQELPSFMIPLLLLLFTSSTDGTGLTDGTGPTNGRTLLVCTFMLHYLHRSFVFALLTRGRAIPLTTFLSATVFCSLNGFLQGHHLLHCRRYSTTWLMGAHEAAGFLLFVAGLTVNIHSDWILRNLRRPGEVVYKIPYGGMFEFVSGANFFGEIVEWSGYAMAVWSLPAFAFAFFTVCSIGPRAYHHHRDYQERFGNYPRSRKALIPFIF